MLDTFKGDIVTEYIEDNIIPDEEIAQILGITDL